MVKSKFWLLMLLVINYFYNIQEITRVVGFKINF
jgi:hypothetical protein